MFQTSLKRALGVLVALLFGLNSAELRAVHVCPLHDGIPAATAPASGHHHHAAPSHNSQAPERHSCTCPDSACSTAAVAALPTKIVLLDSSRAVDDASPSHATAERPRSWTPHLLPYPQGPPVSALIV